MVVTGNEALGRVSLLWPERPAAEAGERHYPAWAEDVDLDHLVQHLAHHRRGIAFLRSTLVSLPRDPDLIRYRQEVFADLEREGNLASRLASLLPSLQELDEVRQHAVSVQDNQLLQVLQRLRELELYVEAAQQALSAFTGVEIRSRGLDRLRRGLEAETRSPGFVQLAAELPAWRAAMRKLASVTVGINLDEEGRPVGATLLSVSEAPYGPKKTLLGRLLGTSYDQQAVEANLAPLHEVAADSPSPFLQPIFRDLAEVLRLSSRPVAQALSHYVRVSVTPLASLAAELGFYLGATKLAARLRAAGLPVCIPELRPEQERAAHVRSLYNPCLALRLLETSKGGATPTLPVASDLSLGDEGRAAVLTGPNMGGKTTFIQAVALAQALAQAGLFVPGEAAAISPADGIFTHFPRLEQPDKALGRLGEEAQRLASLFEQATSHSLVLLNESLSSTSPGESLYLAREVLAALRLLGARVVFATHLHELAGDLREVNAVAPDEPPTVSLVAGIAAGRDGADDLGRTYRVEPGPPRGKSYAEEIARRHGISLEQLRARLRDRGT